MNLEGTKKISVTTESELPSFDNPDYSAGTPEGSVGLTFAELLQLNSTNDNLRTFASIDAFNGSNPEVLDWPNGTKLIWGGISGNWGYAPTIRIGPEGQDSHPADLRHQGANLGALIGISDVVAGNRFLIYFSKDFLRTYVTFPGGPTVPVEPRRAWQNITGFNLQMRFYMNDVRGTYGDNHGTIAHTTIITPLQ